MLLGINTIVIDLEDAKKIVEGFRIRMRISKKYTETLEREDLLGAFLKLEDKVKELEDIQEKMYGLEDD